jgi:serine protein kinase
METDKAIFEKLILEDRASRESRHWRGTFLVYLDRVREDPSITKLAHARSMK